MHVPGSNSDGNAFNYDHYLDNLLFVEEGFHWLSMCNKLLLAYLLEKQSYKISPKSHTNLV